jgi:hypothetical protein
MAGCGIPSTLPEGYYTTARGRALPGRRDATRAPVRFGGANPEQTAHERLSRPDTRQHERAGQAVRDGTGQQRPIVCVRLDTEESAQAGPHATWAERIRLVGRVGTRSRHGAIRGAK